MQPLHPHELELVQQEAKKKLMVRNLRQWLGHNYSRAPDTRS